MKVQSNKNVKGRAVFSGPQQIKERSLKLYSYLVCRAYLRNAPTEFGDNVRIFQQRDINLAEIKRIFHMDERTIKKCWEGLEDERLIKFTPHGWEEQLYDDNGEPISFIERWKVRRKHGETYYEMPIKGSQLFRKIPKETLVELNEVYNINELTLKIYMSLVNYQEECILNNISFKKFTYLDLRALLGYSKQNNINRKMEHSLLALQSLGLIDIKTGNFINTNGLTIPCFVLQQANFYINYDIKDFKPGEEHAMEEDIISKIREKNKELYPEAFS